jgi:NADPH:quinone reductase-like Zn-dependent oxidoreductase
VSDNVVSPGGGAARPCSHLGRVRRRRHGNSRWRTFPLAETAAALDASNAGHANGKIVVVP